MVIGQLSVDLFQKGAILPPMTVDTEKLINALAALKRISQLRNTLEILDSTLFECCELGLNLRTTNLTDELEVALPYSGDPLERGVCVNTSNIHGLLVGLRSKDLELTITDGRLHVLAADDSFQTSLAVLPAEEYPSHVASAIDQSWEFSAARQELRGAMAHALAAASSDSSRYVLNSVAIDADGDNLNIVGTDGRRLQMSTIEFDGEIDETVIIGASTVATMCSALGESDEDVVTVTGGKGAIRFETKNTVMASKLIEGTYPNYRMVIPDRGSFVCEMSCDAKQLGEAIARSQAILSKSIASECSVTLSPADGQLTVSARSLAENVTSQSVKAEGWREGAMSEGRFSAAFIKSAMAGASVATLHIPSSGNDPILITNPDNDHTQAVVMPMRIQ